MPGPTLDLALRLKAAVEGLSQITALAQEITALGGDATTVEGQAADLAEQLGNLSRQQAVIEAFKQIGQQVAASRAELDRKRQALSDHASALAATTAAERQLEGAVREDEAALAKQAKTLVALEAELQRAEAAHNDSTIQLERSTRALERAGIETTQLSAAEQRVTRETINARTAVSELTQRLESERDSLRSTANEADRAGGATRRLGSESQEAADRAATLDARLGSVLRTAIALTGINLGANLVADLARIADEAKSIEARLRLTTRGTEEYTAVSQQLLEVAQETGTALGATATLYDRLDDAVFKLGGTTQDAVAITETINKTLAVGGGAAEAQNAAIIQLAQGLASGTLRGEELNSVLEQAPRLAKAFADGLGVTTAELRGLAEQGRLTPEALIDALASQAPKIEEEFAQIPKTISRALTEVRNAFVVAVGSLDQTSGASAGHTAVISQLATAIRELSQDGSLTAFAGAATAAAGVVQVGFNTLTGIIKGLKAAAELAAGGISLALSKVTFGDVSAEFEAVGRSLIEQSQTTAASIEQDNRDIEAGYRRVAEGASTFSDGVNGIRGAADIAEPSLDTLDAASTRLAVDLQAVAPAAVSATATLSALGDVAGQVEASIDQFGEASLASLSKLAEDLGAVSRTAEEEARGAAETYREINEQLDAEQQARDSARAESVAQAESEYTRLRTAVLAATDLGEIEALRAENTRLFAAGTVGFTEYRQVIADADAQLQQLTVNTGAGFDALFGLIGGLRQSYAEVSAGAAAAFDEINLRAGRSGVLVGRYLREVNDGVIRLNQSVAEQARSADTLLANLQDVGGATVTDIRLAQQAAQSFTLLDQTRLGQLQSAIDAATQRLERLRDTARDTVSGLQDELDQLRGNEDAIQARRDAARKAEIQAQLDLARQLQDREAAAELERSLALLQEISRERDRQNRDAPRTAVPESVVQGRQPVRQQEPGFITRTVSRVEFVVPGRAEPVAGDFAPDDAIALLDLLGRAKAVSLR